MDSDQLNLQETLVNKTKEPDSFIRDIQDNLPSSSIYVFFLSIFLAMAWVLYITLYNSRVFGLIITVIINKFVKYGHIKFGKLKNRFGKEGKIVRLGINPNSVLLVRFCY